MFRTYLRKIIKKADRLTAKPVSKAYIPRPLFEAERPGLDKMLLITCSRTFNQDKPRAQSLMRAGFARGWAKECGPAKLIPIDQLMSEIGSYDKPAVFISVYEFAQLTYADAKRLRNVDLFVWISVHPRTNARYEREILEADKSADANIWLDAYGKIVKAEPKFVWNAVGKAGMEWYQGWIDDGFKWQTIYPAVDTTHYFPEPNEARFGQIKMAYVGGYWAEKAQGFDLYLRPWEDVLVPFGFDNWPYKNYGGALDMISERQLYSTVGLIPLITGPLGWKIAEITERYVKAPACKAFCISDHNAALREIFASNEMIQAENPEHFHQLVRDALADKIDRLAWVTKAHQAVLERHTYAHRALQIRDALRYQQAV